MENGYTNFNEQSIKNFALTSESDAAANFLRDKKNFRPFDEGLTEILQKVNFRGDLSNAYEKTAFLMEKLSAINSKITRKTVLSWFNGERRPKIEPSSRPKMYEICFALNLNLEQVQWFFHHVYYDRMFNYHVISEVVYYYAFMKNVSQDAANKIIAEIEAAPTKKIVEGEVVYTQLIKNRVTTFETVDELKEFLIQNKNSFATWNKSALYKIQMLFTEIVGDEKICKDIVQQLKRTVAKNRNSNIFFSEDKINKCGLLLRYICQRAQVDKNSGGKYVANEIDDAISGKNLFSHTFVLDNFLGMLSGIEKAVDVPYILKNNFPAKKILSDVLDENKISVSKSYDAIRKTLILFHFYDFWYKINLGEAKNLEPEEIENLPEIYREEIDATLVQCGYDRLFAGNPYDWLFLCSANSKDPIDSENFSYAIEFFSNIVGDLTYEY